MCAPKANQLWEWKCHSCVKMVLQRGEEAMPTGMGIFISWLCSSSDTNFCLCLSSKKALPEGNFQCNLCCYANFLSCHNPDYCKYIHIYIFVYLHIYIYNMYKFTHISMYSCMHMHMYFSHIHTSTSSCILTSPLSVVVVQANQLYDQWDTLIIDNMNRGITWWSGRSKKVNLPIWEHLTALSVLDRHFVPPFLP